MGPDYFQTTLFKSKNRSQNYEDCFISKSKYETCKNYMKEDLILLKNFLLNCQCHAENCLIIKYASS